MAGERDRLVADPLHQAAVAAEDVGVVIDDLVAELRGQHALGERHADRVADALAERPGRRLDAARMAALGMAGGAAAELAETLDLVDRHVGIAGQVQQPVEQHRAVPVRQRRSGRGRANPGPAGRSAGTCVNSTVAMSAMPIGMPGWPDLAFSTASIASARSALAMRRSFGSRGAGSGGAMSFIGALYLASFPRKTPSTRLRCPSGAWGSRGRGVVEMNGRQFCGSLRGRPHPKV